MPGSVHNIYNAEVTFGADTRSLSKNLSSINARLKSFSNKMKLKLNLREPTDGLKKLEQRAAAAARELEFMQRHSDYFSSGTIATQKEVVALFDEEIKRIYRAGEAFQKPQKGASRFGNAIKGAASGVIGLGNRIKHLGSKIIAPVNKALNKMKRGLKMGTGIKGLVRLGIAGAGVYAIIRGLRQGFENLEKYSGEVGSSLNMLRNSLATMKNALATAFAPIFTAIAPAINALINLITRAATAVAHFVAAFTGKSSVVVAKPYTAVAGAADDATGATNAANDAAKEYKNTLLGFDQMNILNAADSSSGSSGGGGAAGGGASDMFETVSVSNSMSNLAAKIKEAWKKKDFEDLGLDVGNWIAAGLDKIPWDKIQNVAGALGSSIATGANGLNKSAFWRSLGRAIASAMNTALEFCYQLVTKFDFKQAGRAIGLGLDKAIKTFNWKKLGKTIYKGIKGAIQGIGSFFKTVDWKNLGKSIVDTIAEINWVQLFTEALRTGKAIVDGAWEFLKGAFSEAAKKLKKWFTSGQIWEDMWELDKAAFEFTVDLVGKGWEALKTLLNGIKSLLDKLLGRNTPETDPTKNSDSLSVGGGKDSNLNYGVVKGTLEITKLSDKLTAAQKTIGGATAKMQNTTYKSLPDYKKVVPGAKANVTNTTYKNLPAAKKMVGGVTANVQSMKDAVPPYGKFLGNGTLSVTKIIFAGNALMQLQAAFTKKAGGGLYRGGRWRPITAAASGGYFSQGQLFLARESGPELVGKMGGGTGVMNNDQIVASVSAGVYKAVREAMSGNEGQQVVIIAPDGNELFKLMKSEAQAYTNSTGLAPFPV